MRWLCLRPVCSSKNLIIHVLVVVFLVCVATAILRRASFMRVTPHGGDGIEQTTSVLASPSENFSLVIIGTAACEASRAPILSVDINALC